MSKSFASHGDTDDKKITFQQLAENAYAFTTEGDPNSGVIIGPDSVMVIDAQATPKMAASVIEKIRTVTDKPIKYVVLSHYHAVRVLGASAYQADHVIASRDTHDLIVERGEQDFKSELERFPRLFQGVESVPGLTWPSLIFKGELSIMMGDSEVRIMQLGRGHTKGDTVVWMPKEKVLFAGDLVEYGATPYTGDAYLTDWLSTLDAVAALGAEKLVPGRGEALTTTDLALEAISGTRAFLTGLVTSVKECRAKKLDLRETYARTYEALKPEFGEWVIFDHCLPFDVSRAYDELGEHSDPRIWTAERDHDMWSSMQVEE